MVGSGPSGHLLCVLGAHAGPRGPSELAAVQLHLLGQLLPNGQQGAGSVGRTGQQLPKPGPFLLPARKDSRAQPRPCPCLQHLGWGQATLGLPLSHRPRPQPTLHTGVPAEGAPPPAPPTQVRGRSRKQGCELCVVRPGPPHGVMTPEALTPSPQRCCHSGPVPKPSSRPPVCSKHSDATFQGRRGQPLRWQVVLTGAGASGPQSSGSTRLAGAYWPPCCGQRSTSAQPAGHLGPPASRPAEAMVPHWAPSLPHVTGNTSGLADTAPKVEKGPRRGGRPRKPVSSGLTPKFSLRSRSLISYSSLL